MLSTKRACLFGCAASALALALPAAAQETRAEVIHWWTSGGESAALQAFADAFEAQGGEWVDTAIAGGQNARTQGINRIVGGQPPTAMQFNTGRQFEEIVEGGLLASMDEAAEEGGWAELIPPAFADAITFDGSVYAVPVNIHGQNWLFYNRDVLEAAGLEPPETWADVVEMAPALQEAGVIPLAQGGEAWQERTLFLAVLLSQGGRELYEQVLAEVDIEAVRGDAFREVVETVVSLREFVDEGSPGRTWNLTTNLVVTGQAAMQLMGDWAKGEFIAAELAAGEDYGCALVGPNETLIMGGDVFVFPVTQDEGQQAAQRTLAEVMFSPEAQIAFNTIKGSIPIRTDVDVSEMDACAQAGAERVQSGDAVAVINMLASSDLVGAMDDVITQFWNNPAMSVDDFIEDLALAMETAG